MLDSASHHGFVTVHPARRAIVAAVTLLLAITACAIAVVIAVQALSS